MAVSPRGLSDYLLSHGRPVVTLSEAAGILGVDVGQASAALVRLRRANQMFSPARGLYIAVPPEHRMWGAIPAMDFIDPMMRALGREYYVGLLSAAELHGAAHQRPQVFQVMADGRVDNRDFGRVRVRFYRLAGAGRRPVELRNTRTGQARVATAPVVALDLASRPRDGGGLSNVATVVVELARAGTIPASSLLAVAPLYPLAPLQRVGWLLDRFGERAVDTEPLARAVTARSPRSDTLLLPGGPRRGHRDQRWGLVENEDVEPDL
ncbi:MAG: type IV toxin-antitoxin system AbiEi family antitoxin [Micrococcales bacterium]|nr:type IV toxin-antitoxin system AbiEi family antitoxin [Micrococcales bacterium]MCL2668037.1 type IV toxin-antitoxin system AbiEi family antitoxin [Micrococcales bacterium]